MRLFIYNTAFSHLTDNKAKQNLNIKDCKQQQQHLSRPGQTNNHSGLSSGTTGTGVIFLVRHGHFILF